MGYTRHHAIVVTAYDRSRIDAAHVRAIALKMSVSAIIESEVNTYHSFLIGPDGSKEGTWRESHQGDRRRATFVEWLDSQRHDDGSSPYTWAVIMYGDDEGEAAIEGHSGEKAREVARRAAVKALGRRTD